MDFKHTIMDERFISEAIYGARLSYGNNAKSDSELIPGALNGASHSYCLIGPDDRRFLEARLGAGISGEDKFLRTIPVSVVITAPLKWWVELDTYKIGTVRQSASLMHRLSSKGAFTAKDFEVRNPYDPRFVRMLEDLNEAYQEWMEAGARRHDKYPEWTEWQDLIPRSYLYESHWTANYATLRNIYFQRRHHRMRLWQDFIGWMESLPHSWLLTYERERTR